VSGQPAETSIAPTISTDSKSCYSRGTGLVSVSTLPGKTPLSRASVNVIELRQKLAFAVTVHNSGCLTETQLRVTLSISGSQPGMTTEGLIDRMNPGETKTVVLGNLGLPDLQKKLIVRVEVEAVPAETKIDDNSAEYPVRFTLL
jgi:hypothetical protein